MIYFSQQEPGVERFCLRRHRAERTRQSRGRSFSNGAAAVTAAGLLLLKHHIQSWRGLKCSGARDGSAGRNRSFQLKCNFELEFFLFFFKGQNYEEDSMKISQDGKNLMHIYKYKTLTKSGVSYGLSERSLWKDWRGGGPRSSGPREQDYEEQPSDFFLLRPNAFSPKPPVSSPPLAYHPSRLSLLWLRVKRATSSPGHH